MVLLAKWGSGGGIHRRPSQLAHPATSHARTTGSRGQTAVSDRHSLSRASSSAFLDDVLADWPSGALREPAGLEPAGSNTRGCPLALTSFPKTRCCTKKAAAASQWRLVSETTGRTVVARLTIADGFWSRLAGLQLRRPLPADAGLLLVPCRSVHTCFVRFPVDVLFLDGKGCVLAVRRGLRPWRAAWGPRGSHAALEVIAGSADCGPGEKLRLEPAEGESPPPGSVSFLRK